MAAAAAAHLRPVLLGAVGGDGLLLVTATLGLWRTVRPLFAGNPQSVDLPMAAGADAFSSCSSPSSRPTSLASPFAALEFDSNGIPLPSSPSPLRPSRAAPALYALERDEFTSVRACFGDAELSVPSSEGPEGRLAWWRRAAAGLVGPLVSPAFVAARAAFVRSFFPAWLLDELAPPGYKSDLFWTFLMFGVLVLGTVFGVFLSWPLPRNVFRLVLRLCWSLGLMICWLRRAWNRSVAWARQKLVALLLSLLADWISSVSAAQEGLGTDINDSVTASRYLKSQIDNLSAKTRDMDTSLAAVEDHLAALPPAPSAESFEALKASLTSSLAALEARIADLPPATPSSEGLEALRASLAESAAHLAAVKEEVAALSSAHAGICDAIRVYSSGHVKLKEMFDARVRTLAAGDVSAHFHAVLNYISSEFRHVAGQRAGAFAPGTTPPLPSSPAGLPGSPHPGFAPQGPLQFPPGAHQPVFTPQGFHPAHGYGSRR